jgi:esterase/lipase superfamily enzyme
VAEQTQRAFLDLLMGLADGGVRSVHIMAHSMGARAFMASLPRVHKAVQSAQPFCCCALRVTQMCLVGSAFGSAW